MLYKMMKFHSSHILGVLEKAKAKAKDKLAKVMLEKDLTKSCQVILQPFRQAFHANIVGKEDIMTQNVGSSIQNSGQNLSQKGGGQAKDTRKITK